jgi:pyruvate/2-oxoglutarate dehydrogenase complex dihydrolipoamide acyltransferase (E2) component
MVSMPINLPTESGEDEVELTDWLVPDGAVVEADQAVAEVSTAKASVEVLAPIGGRLRHGVAVGDLIDVGGAIGTVDRD